MTREMIASGASLSMRPADYERKVRSRVGGELSRQERATVRMHYEQWGTDPERLAIALLEVRISDRNRRAMAEASEMYDRGYEVEL